MNAVVYELKKMTGKDDLRRITMKDTRGLLLSFGVDDEKVCRLKRSGRVVLLKDLIKRKLEGKQSLHYRQNIFQE